MLEFGLVILAIFLLFTITTAPRRPGAAESRLYLAREKPKFRGVGGGRRRG